MKSFLVVMVLACSAMSVSAADAPKGLEDAINAAMASKRGVTLYVNGQTVAGAITKVEPGQYVELRSQEFGKIVVRWERIDGIAMP
jgi:opacity protein-like surface antigen